MNTYTTYVSIQKMQDRKAALERTVFTDEHQQGRWLEVMKPDFMSSEESDIDGEDVLVIRTLPWRYSQVNQLMQKLDDKCFIEKQPLARRQTKRRTPSSRPVPLRNVPGWAIELRLTMNLMAKLSL